MTLDEAIAHEKEVAKYNQFQEYYEYLFEKIVIFSHPDAIDELSNALCDELDKGYVFINKNQIVHFAEQLKAGGMNEYNI